LMSDAKPASARMKAVSRRMGRKVGNDCDADVHFDDSMVCCSAISMSRHICDDVNCEVTTRKS
jgi:hypothetical protein